MRTDWRHLEPHRVTPGGGVAGERSGAFQIPMGNRMACVIADDGLTDNGEPGEPTGWEHVSVHMQTVHGDICPSWNEMSKIKDLFFKPDEVVMQLHFSKADHINIHPAVLHLWRPIHHEIPLPPKGLV